jgi:hypothetical protein
MRPYRASMSRHRRIFALVAISLLATAGCRGGSDRDHRAGGDSSHYSIVLESAKPDWDAPLPPSVCYVASRNYEVTITGRSERRHGLCNRLAATYLPDEPRLRWPPPYLRDPDKAPSVVCVLSHTAERLEVDYGPRDSGRLDAESICEALIDRGWRQRPAWQGLDWP